ncbi:MAG TPA: hypothetical protein VN851_02415, partial [Thermoanaerobaculia bacterium]|nr:hypothetical protein [Thermoanaerobaculia bacterium]
TTNGAGDLVFGSTAAGTCATPGVGGLGNTRASRTAYYTVSRGKEIASGWLSGVAWLNTPLTANVNLTGACNGYWSNPVLQLYRAIPGMCGASGEEPGFILHELGHGIDDNDGIPGGSTGESYGDTNAAIVLHNSCVGAGFWPTNCTGYGDACTSCTGLRDVDWARHASNLPHTVANYTQVNCGGGGGPCGREVHCESYVPSEAVWDLANRDLPAPSTDSAWAVVERLFYSSRPTASAAFSCSTAAPTWTSNGCNIGSMFRALRAADDDDGDLTNGTPHGGAIFAALDRHGIACASDPGSSTTHTGCTPPPTPTLTVAGGSDAVNVSWTNSGAGIVYDVLRSETGCDAAFVHAATATASTSFPDASGNVANGSVYSYEVVAYPSGNPACSSPPSACLSTHLSGADPSIRPWGAALDPQTPPYWQTPDIWVDNQPNGIPNEAGEPSRGITNQLFARITNAGNADAGDYRVTFRAKPYTTSASAPAALIGTRDESGALAPGAARESQIAWDLSDAWVHANFDPMFWSATHFCVQVGIGAAGVPLVDTDLSDNDAQNNFDNIPLSAGVGGVASAEFFIYNHLDRQAMASLVSNPRESGWNVGFRGIADPARIPLGPHQWLPVTAIAAPSADGRQPEKGRPVLIDVSQTIDGTTVGGLTFAVQPPDFGDKGKNPPPASASSKLWLGVRTGGAWPFDPTRRRYTAGFHFGASLEREMNPHFRLGLAAGYDALAGRSSTGNLGITRLGLGARFLGGASSWRPYASAGVGAYRAAGSWKPGVALGLGLDLPISSVLGLTTGIEAHDVESTPAGDLRWIEAFVGLRARLP